MLSEFLEYSDVPNLFSALTENTYDTDTIADTVNFTLSLATSPVCSLVSNVVSELPSESVAVIRTRNVKVSMSPMIPVATVKRVTVIEVMLIDDRVGTNGTVGTPVSTKKTGCVEQ